MSKAASPYLHDRLQARRANPTRARRSDSGLRTQHLEDDLFISEAQQHEGSSYAASNTTSDPNHTQSLGAREMGKRMDKLSKLNFDLKMELFHCRERMVKLQENCKSLALSADKANKLGEENSALLDLHDTLVKELENRDEAVHEAVTIICELEEKLERTQPQPQPRYITPPRAPVSSIPSDTLLSPPTSSQSSDNKMSSSRPQRRLPSFVGEKKPSTRALRSVYLEPVPTLHAVKSFASLISQREEADDVDALNSPQLSVLSESSFPSIYNPLEETAPSDRPEEQNALFQHLRQMDTSLTQRRSSDNSGSDLNSWIRVQTPQPSTFLMEPGYLHQARLKAPPSQQQPRSVPPGNQSQRKRPSQDDSGFGEGLLPPTPESASTFVLQESHSEFADANDSHAKPGPKVLESFANAAKQTAFLHTPEDCAALGSRKTKPSSHPRSVPSDLLWMSTRRSIDLSSSEGELDYNDGHEIDPALIDDDDQDEVMYPNGGSILTGTPSRFQVRHSTSPATNLIFDGNGINHVAARPPARRRNTSSEIPFQHLPNVKPRGMERSETSPNVATLGTATTTRTDRTSRAFDHQDQLFSTPDKSGRHVRLQGQWSSTKSPPSKSQATAPSGMRASLSQKTHKLLRRMSDGRGGESPASKVRPVTANSATNPTRVHAYTSSRRPSTGYNTVTHREQDEASCTHSEKLHSLQRPSRDRDLMALQAANQTISRRQSEEVHARGMTLSPGSSRSLFKRAGSIRR